MYLVSRAQMVELVREDLHEPTSGGAFTDAKTVRHMQRALDLVWDELTAQVEGPGRVQEQRTIAVGDPDGYVPGNLVPMPARWRRLVVVRQNGARLGEGRPDRADIGCALRYWVDGPNQVTSGGLLVPYSARLLTSTPWAAGDELDWIYVERAPLWVDPADATRDVQVDLASDEIATAIAAVAAARAVARSDREALGRARGELTAQLQRFKNRARDLHQRPRRLSDYQRGGSHYRP